MYNEIKYMAQLDHPFIVPMLGVYQDPKLLYLLLEYAPAGELMQLIKEQKRLDPTYARFYAA